MNLLKQISEMTKEELKEHLEGMRLQRKQGYEPKKRARRNNPFGDLDPEVAKMILEELEKQKTL